MGGVKSSKLDLRGHRRVPVFARVCDLGVFWLKRYKVALFSAALAAAALTYATDLFNPGPQEYAADSAVSDAAENGSPQQNRAVVPAVVAESSKQAALLFSPSAPNAGVLQPSVGKPRSPVALAGSLALWSRIDPPAQQIHPSTQIDTDPPASDADAGLPPLRGALDDVPLPRARPRASEAQPTTADIRAATPAPQNPFEFLQKLFAQGRPDLQTPPEANGRTAVYDISARTVFLPNGQKLEAHSGLGKFLDDARFVGQRAKGPTPPNTYQLTIREAPFHGVEAIRMTPVGKETMYGRAGILVHPYMLGTDGASNGCVSIQDYPKFLQAFKNGEVNRLVVVSGSGTDANPVPTARAPDDTRFASF
jgi:hypothetical protein